MGNRGKKINLQKETMLRNIELWKQKNWSFLVTFTIFFRKFSIWIIFTTRKYYMKILSSRSHPYHIIYSRNSEAQIVCRWI